MPTHLLIKQKRRELGITQAALANLIAPYIKGIDDVDISRIETGRRAVKADELPIFAKALKCGVEDLVDSIPE